MVLIYVCVLVVFNGYRLYRYSRLLPRAYAEDTALDNMPMDGPLVSFLVPAWNAVGDISEFLKAFETLSYPRKELMLCVGGSDGGYAEALKFDSSAVKILRQEAGEGKQKALAKSYQISQGEIIYLTDIDCRLSDDVVLNLLNPLLKQGEKVVTGTSRPLVRQQQKAFVMTQWAIERAGINPDSGETTGLLGRNAALVREAVDATEQFRISAPTGTDYTLAKEVLRAGYRIWFVPGSSIPTEFPESMGTYVRKQGRWIANVVRLGWRYRAWNEVKGALTTVTMPIIIIALIVFGVWWSEFLVLGALLVLQALWNRLDYCRLSGIRADLVGVFQSFGADLMASLSAGWRIAMDDVKW